MRLSVTQGFTKSLAMTVLSEIGDNTFFAAAILAMRHPRRDVLAGCLASLVVMTVLSALLGWVAPNLISRKWAHHITTLLFFGFGLWTLWEGDYRRRVVLIIDFNSSNREDEQAEAEAKLMNIWDADLKADAAPAKADSKAKDDSNKQRRSVLAQFFSPIFLKLATIGLAADENPLGVVIGGILGQALCTIAAVVGGKSLASKISEKMVSLAGVLFLVFGIQSFLSPVDS